MSFNLKLFGKVIIPLSYYLKGDTRFRYFEDYKKNLKKSRKEIQEYQLKRLKKLVHHAYETVPYYKELFDKNKIKPEDIKTIDDLKKIPVLEKKVILDNVERLKSTKKYKLIKTFSGGSTGNKVTIYKDKRYYQMCAGIRLRDLYSAGVQPDYKAAWVWGDTAMGLSLKARLLDKLSFKLNRRILFNVFNYTDDEVAAWLEKSFNRFKPDYIYGYPGVIYDMAKVIKERHINIFPIKIIVTTAERLEHRKFIEKVFNCPVIDQYGCSEVNTIAIEDQNQVMHSSDDFVVVEIDENNSVLLTPLESYGMPLLRYKVGDIGLINKKPTKKSSLPFKEFNIVIGRTYELLLNKKKEKVSGGLIKQIAEDEYLDINEFQVVQKSLDDVELNIVKDKFTKEKSIKRLTEIIKETLGTKRVKVKYLKTFPTEPNGKRIAFKCEIKDQK